MDFCNKEPIVFGMLFTLFIYRNTLKCQIVGGFLYIIDRQALVVKPFLFIGSEIDSVRVRLLDYYNMPLS